VGSTAWEPPRNRLLAALPATELARLRPHLTPTVLSVRRTLSKADAPIDYAYFIEWGEVSLTAPFDEGETIEVGVIGREGLVGIGAVHGAERSSIGATVQVEGAALRVRAGVLRQAAERSKSVMRLLLKFSYALQRQVAQSAACNGKHTLEKRLARRLLMAHDRNGSDDLPVTHDSLALMLGARRPGVTTAMGLFKAAKLLDSLPGRISVLDRAGLEAAACPCYAILRREYARLLR